MNCILALAMFGTMLAAAPQSTSKALAEQNRILNETNDSLYRANSALRDQPIANQSALEEAKAAAERAARQTDSNRILLAQAKTELATQIHSLLVSMICWFVAILVGTLSVAAAGIYMDHNRVKLAQSVEFQEILRAIENINLSGRIESQKASTSRERLQQGIEKANDMAEAAHGAANHVNEKIVFAKRDTEDKINKIECTTDKSHLILEQIQGKNKENG